MKIHRLVPSLTAAAVVAGLAPLLVVSTADAAPAPYRVVKVTPSTGDYDTLPVFETSGLCTESNAKTFSVSLQGANLPEDNLVGTTDLSLAASSTFGGKKYQAGSSFKTLFNTAGATPSTSPYTLTWYCQTSQGVALSSFTGQVSFASASGSYTYTASYDNPATETTVAPIDNGSGANSFTYGDSVTLSASVAAAANGPVSAGTVQFLVDGSPLGAPQAVSNGVATYTTTAIKAGLHTVTASYVPGGAAFGASTSSTPRSVVVAKRATTVTLTDASSTGSSEQYAAASFTAQATAGVAGSVDFFVDGTKVATKTVDATGAATYSDKTLAVGTHQVYAVFTPTDTSIDASTSATVTHAVTKPSTPPAVETLNVNVQPGSLVISIATGEDGQVTLTDPTLDQSGDMLVSTGAIDPITITDSRAGDPGWNASASVSDFVNSKDANAKISGYDLGWTPKVVTTASNMTGGFTLGGQVAPALVLAGTKPANAAQGLYDARTFATTTDDHGDGTAKLAADLLLQVPTELPPGLYTATMTFTVL